MMASEPADSVLGNRNVLIDTAGTPGMSGSPVFVSHLSYIDTPEYLEAQRRLETGEATISDGIGWLGISREQQTVGLEWVGVYAGATEAATLARLQLGRMYSARSVMEILADGVAGSNPFPPDIPDA